MPSDLSEEQCKELGKKYAELIRWHPYVKKKQFLDITAEGFNSELDAVVGNFEAIGPYEEINALEYLNDQLSALYDWADMERVWVTGFRD